MMNNIRSLFEKDHHYRKALNTKPLRDCLTCGKSTSEPHKPYDRLHCSQIPCDEDIVDEDNTCDLWN
jgi:hypothetical protein